MSNFFPDTRGQWWSLFLGSLVQSCCGEGGILQQISLACARSVSATVALPLLTACVLSHLHCSGSRLLCWGLSEVGPGLHALPRSKPLRFRFSGTPQRCRLSWACVLYPSQAQAAQVTRCLVSTLSPGRGCVSYHLPNPSRWVYWIAVGAPPQVCRVSLLES